jgi:hypothetical protein
MNANPPHDRSQEVTAPPQDSTPRPIGYGHPEFHFVQAIMEMQKSLGEIKSEISALRTTTDSIKAKVDDLVKWKHMIAGGAITIGFLIGIAVAAVKLLPK